MHKIDGEGSDGNTSLHRWRARRRRTVGRRADVVRRTTSPEEEALPSPTSRIRVVLIPEVLMSTHLNTSLVHETFKGGYT